jgi:sulfatase modifying factor 1
MLQWSCLLVSTYIAFGCADGNGKGVGASDSDSDTRASGDGDTDTDTDTEADTGIAPPSCQSGGPGVTDCGPNAESCCKSIEVPGGTFYRTYMNDGGGAEDTTDPATISDFRLDKYLVTVGRFRRFVAAWASGAGYIPPEGSGRHTHLSGGQGLADSGMPGAFETGWTALDNDNLAPTNENLACSSEYATWTGSPGSNENLPINCVNWWEAYAFCIWDGGVLPSEAEHTYAAVGGDEQRRYPWGSTAPGGDSQYAIYDCNYPDGSGTCSGIASIAPVGAARLGAGRWGHLDLVGELTQWNLDWFTPSYVTPCTDCAYLAYGSGRVMRDGYFASAGSALLASYRNNGLYPTNRFQSFGFRCARVP